MNFDIGETYDGEVDWDSEWKKVVQNQGQPKERPGKDFYKNDVEKAIGKTARTAQEKISKIAKVKIDLPSQPRAMSFRDDAKVFVANNLLFLVFMRIVFSSCILTLFNYKAVACNYCHHQRSKRGN